MSICFGIISIFGIEELLDERRCEKYCFGIISIFGIEELEEKEVRTYVVLVSSQFLV